MCVLGKGHRGGGGRYRGSIQAKKTSDELCLEDQNFGLFTNCSVYIAGQLYAAWTRFLLRLPRANPVQRNCALSCALRCTRASVVLDWNSSIGGLTVSKSCGESVLCGLLDVRIAHILTRALRIHRHGPLAILRAAIINLFAQQSMSMT